MSYKRLVTLLVLFIGGYAGIASAAHDPTQLVFDWNALSAGLIAAGLAQPALSDASVLVQLVTTFCAFLVGYGAVESAVGYRYGIDFDWRAVMAGLAASGLVHSQNTNVTAPIVEAVGGQK